MASADSIDPAAVERFIGEPLPRGATAIRSDGESGVDTRTLLRFDAPLVDATGFAARLLGRDPKPGEDPVLGHFGTGIDWWSPAAGPGSAGGRADDRARNRSYRVLVVPKQGGMATVWLVAFSS
ncbi:hypothetical protein COC42_03950 [Sphingomonas spermidinifaciens]|uniref:Uncharacterized protein n=2 Tax=Sphingomonas spermidinifaciens TaxID=1141889 RepID=A0A2A4B7B7_9SPHN|nr:hypothetical protein COC42_03950 [Sphingomonas spermidinifaciens]